MSTCLSLPSMMVHVDSQKKVSLICSVSSQSCISSGIIEQIVACSIHLTQMVPLMMFVACQCTVLGLVLYLFSPILA